jgi:hypothetical protein
MSLPLIKISLNAVQGWPYAEAEEQSLQLVRRLLTAVHRDPKSSVLWAAVERSCSTCLPCIFACHQLQQALGASNEAAAADLLCHRAAAIAKALQNASNVTEAASSSTAAAQASGNALYAFLEALVFHRLLRDLGVSHYVSLRGNLVRTLAKGC